METFEPGPARDVDSINNLDTAKMTLRWAIEKLRSQEREMAALQKESERERGEFAAQLLSLRELESRNATLQKYYRKVEAQLAEHGAGKVDVADLLRREAELETGERDLHDRRLSLEDEFSKRKQELAAQVDNEQRSLREHLEQQIEVLKRDFHERQSQLEKIALAREQSIPPAQLALDKQREALETSAARLEEGYRQRAQLLTEEAARLKAQALRQADERIADWRAQHESRLALEERQRTLDRQSLIEQAAHWEAIARENLKRLDVAEAARIHGQGNLSRRALDAEKRVRELEDAAAQESLRIRQLEQRAKATQDQTAALEKSLSEERARADEWRLAAETARQDAAALKDAFVRLEAEMLLRREQQVAAAVEEIRRKEAEAGGKRAAELEKALVEERARTDEWRLAAEKAGQEQQALKDDHARANVEWTRQSQKFLTEAVEDVRRLEAAQADRRATDLEKALVDERARTHVWRLASEKARQDASALKDEFARLDAERSLRREQDHAAAVDEIRRTQAAAGEHLTLKLEKALAEERARADQWRLAAEEARRTVSNLRDEQTRSEPLSALERTQRLEASLEEASRSAAAADARFAALTEELEEERERTKIVRQAADQARLETAAADERTAAFARDLAASQARADEWRLAAETQRQNAAAAEQRVAELKDEQMRLETERASEGERNLEGRVEELRRREAEAARERDAAFERDLAAERAQTAEWRQAAETARQAKLTLTTALGEEHARTEEWRLAAEKAGHEIAALKEDFAKREAKWKSRRPDPAVPDRVAAIETELAAERSRSEQLRSASQAMGQQISALKEELLRREVELARKRAEPAKAAAAPAPERAAVEQDLAAERSKSEQLRAAAEKAQQEAAALRSELARLEAKGERRQETPAAPGAPSPERAATLERELAVERANAQKLRLAAEKAQQEAEALKRDFLLREAEWKKQAQAQARHPATELEQERAELFKDQEAIRKTAEELKNYEAQLARSWQEKRDALTTLREKILKEIESAKGGGAA